MRYSLTAYLKTSVPLHILREGYETTECACFNAFVTDESKSKKKGGKPARKRVKFFTCALHRDDPPPQVNVDIDSVPEGYVLTKRDAFRLKQKKMVEERVAALKKFQEEHGELLNQVAAEAEKED